MQICNRVYRRKDEAVSATEHTPGPWTIERELTEAGTEADAQGRCGVEVHSGGYHIGTWIDSNWDGSSPNARLIAAAPDLLAACRALHEWYDVVKQNYPEMLRPFEAARAAVAKAQD